MLPQLRMMQKAKVVEKFTAHYVFALGLSRFISCAHWILQLVDGDSFLLQALGSGLWPVMVLLSEIVQTFILADFWYAIFFRRGACACFLTSCKLRCPACLQLLLREVVRGGLGRHPPGGRHCVEAIVVTQTHQAPLLRSLMPPAMRSAPTPVSAVRLSVRHRNQWHGPANIQEKQQRATTHTRTTSATGCTKILPSPISPVCAAAVMMRTTLSTCVLCGSSRGVHLVCFQIKPHPAHAHLNTTTSSRAFSTSSFMPCSVPL